MSDEAQILAAYASGLSQRAVAAKFGIIPWKVREVVEAGGVSRSKSPDAVQLSQILDLYKAGNSIAAVAKQTGWGLHIVRQAVTKTGNKRPDKCLTSGQVATLQAKYGGGATIPELSLEFGVHNSVIRKYVKRTTAGLRPNRFLSADKVSLLLDAYQAGETIISLSKRFGISGTSVAYQVRKAGLPARKGIARPQLYTGSETELMCTECKQILPRAAFSQSPGKTSYRGCYWKCRQCVVANNAMKLYNITREQYHVLKAQRTCEICGVDLNVEKHCIDHCHVTKRVRGVLCGRCNSGIGFAKDSTPLLAAMVTYLESPLSLPPPEKTRYRHQTRGEMERYRKFRLREDQYQWLLQQHAGKCRLCGLSYGQPHIDHCHTTGRVRGLLCLPCNLALGQFRDSSVIITSAIFYLERHLHDSRQASLPAPVPSVPVGGGPPSSDRDPV